MSLSFHHHQTQLLGSSLSSLGFPAPWVPTQGCSSHPSLPERFVFAQTHSSLCVQHLQPRCFCFPGTFVFWCFQRVWKSAPGKPFLCWLWLCTARLPGDSPHPKLPKLCSGRQADREAGSCLNPGILTVAKLGSTSPAHPIHQLPKMNGPCSVRARGAQPGMSLSWEKSTPRAVCEDFGTRGRRRGSRTEEEIIWGDPGGISRLPRDQRGPTKPRRAIKKKSIWTTPFF